mgnify:CR=1 FL=1
MFVVVSALEKAGLADDIEDNSDSESGEPRRANTHPSALLNNFLRWAMSSRYANSVMIVVRWKFRLLLWSVYYIDDVAFVLLTTIGNNCALRLW